MSIKNYKIPYKAFIIIMIIGALIVLAREVAAKRKSSVNSNSNKVSNSYMCNLPTLNDTVDIEEFHIPPKYVNWLLSANRLLIFLNNAKLMAAKRNNCEVENIANLATFFALMSHVESGGKDSNLYKKGGNRNNIKCCYKGTNLYTRHRQLDGTNKQVCVVHYDPKDVYGKGTKDGYILSKGEWEDNKKTLKLLSKSKYYFDFRKKVSSKQGITVSSAGESLEGVYAATDHYSELIEERGAESNFITLYLYICRGGTVRNTWTNSKKELVTEYYK